MARIAGPHRDFEVWNRQRFALRRNSKFSARKPEERADCLWQPLRGSFHIDAAYFNCVDMDEKVVLSLVPIR